MSRADLILHPVRMRILVALSGRQLSARQLGHALPDVAHATLYRHLNALVAGRIVLVVAERQVRSATEKVYALDPPAARFTAAELDTFSADDHLRGFTAFVTSLVHDFAQYLDRTTPLARPDDGIRYNMGTLYLNDVEFDQVQADLRALLLPLLAHPSGGRRPHRFAMVLFPTTHHHAANEAEPEQPLP
jgi:DNA-binding transcriptional ArsR family regulator